MPPTQSTGSRYFLCKLIPPRASFPRDMTAEERSAMEEHVQYWTARMVEGTALLFGPVLDPAGPWGLGIVRVEDQTALQRLQEEDPAIRAGIGLRYEALPMARVIAAHVED
jgi:uncharacterized protein YciI